MRSAHTSLYANEIDVSWSFHDGCMRFGLREAGNDCPPEELGAIVDVYMSHTTMKSLIPMLTEMVATIEHQTNTIIPAHGFQANDEAS